jgi:HlyD family secretion protein
MKRFPLQGRNWTVLAVIVPLLSLFIYVALRSGPLAPVSMSIVTVESMSISPALFGIGTVEARYTSKIGSTVAGRLQRLDVQVGDRVKGGQVLGEMDPVDLDDRVRSQESAFKRVEAVLREAKVRQTYAQTQLHRYQQLFAVRSTSEEIVTTKRQELLIADAAYAVAHEDLARSQSDRAVLVAQRANQRLISPLDGVVTVRDADPGTTIVAGQAVVEVIDPKSLWINARFDQISASGLAAALPAHIVLRSLSGQALSGHVLRVELKADAVTEEILAKVIFETQPEALPPVGELAEVTVDLPALPAAPVIPNAAIRREGDKMGVWQIVDGNLHFTPVKLGANDLDGRVQIHEGLKIGDQVVVYSEKALTTRSRIGMVEHIPGVSR